MNQVVSDAKVIVNLQGIRYVHWGESSAVYSSRPEEKFFVTVNYKGNHQTFTYRTEAEARTLFNKIREAMDKSFKNAHTL